MTAFARAIAPVFLVLFSSQIQAECQLETARWAYDEENKILRFCVEDSQSSAENELRCSAFPKQVFLESNPFDLEI
jgi:uncharacterized protein YfeS